jgi:CRP-like cAMP-binding protein
MDPQRLRAVPLFAHLSEEEAKRLAAFATETSFAEGQEIFSQGDFSTELFIIEEGTAKIVRDSRLVATLGPGDVIGERGLFAKIPRVASVIATSPLMVAKLSHWEIRRMSAETLSAIRRVIDEREPFVDSQASGEPQDSPS